MKTLTRWAFALPLLGALLSAPASAQEPPCPFNESRSGLCGHYHSQISPAEAFVDTVVRRGKWSKPHLHPVILDVRSIAEYKAGHPERALNVPYPYIQQVCDSRGRALDGACFGRVDQMDQDPAFFVAYVKRLIPNKKTPIYTLCRTGVRSVGAANVLTDAGYTNVRNIWEGFWGINLKAPKVQADGSVKEAAVDLNHDGKFDHRDLNGWRNHQGLPYDTRLLPHLIYQPTAYLYDVDD